MRRFQLILVLALTGCGTVDKILEGPAAPNGRISVAIAPTPVVLAQGAEQTLTATVTRAGDYTGPVLLSIEGLPTGVTATVGTATAGQVTTATVLLKVAPDAPLGGFLLTLRGKATELTDATTPLPLTITAPPSVNLSLAAVSLSIARGGSAANTVRLVRTNLTSAVTLTLEGATGITGRFNAGPQSPDTVEMIVDVGSAVPAGTHNLVVRASATGATPRSTTLSVNVTNDAFQPVVRPGLSINQNGSISEPVTINRAGYSGPVLLSVDGLPSGLTASFTGNPATGASSTMALAASSSVLPGAYDASLRGVGAGGESVTSPLSITVVASSLAMSLAPASMLVFRGASSTSAVTFTRLNLPAPIVLSVEGAPSGVTAVADPASATGSSGNVVVTVSASALVGDYQLTVRALPQGWAAASAVTQQLAVSVRAPQGVAGNVTLDWTGCSAPNWVASQDGGGGWTPVLGANGIYRFDIATDKGGFAYVEGSNTVVVRYMSRTELIASPIKLCLPAAPTKAVTASAVINNTNDVLNFGYGGGTGQATFATRSQFSITGIRPGVHDLVGFGLGAQGFRIFLRRDVDVPDGGSLGQLSLLSGSEAVIPAVANIFASNPTTGAATSQSMDLLSGPSCMRSQIYPTGTNAGFQNMYGLPVEQQRENDFHFITYNNTTAQQRRTVMLSLKAITSRTIQLPAVVTPGTFIERAGSYKRFETIYSALPAEYNGTTTIRFGSGARSFTLSATRDYTGGAAFNLTMPDFTGLSGWSSAYAIGSSDSGTWSRQLEGVTGGESLCSDGRRAVAYFQTGVF